MHQLFSGLNIETAVRGCILSAHSRDILLACGFVIADAELQV
jgi:hypothetical protein